MNDSCERVRRRPGWVRCTLITLGCVVAVLLSAGGWVLYANNFAIREQHVTIPGPVQPLDGVLALPKTGSGSFGLVVFVHGDGPADASRDAVYRPIWESFARAGYASLSWNKPGIGGAPGNWLDQSMADRADETSAAIDWARTRADIDPHRIGVWGISQGGWVVPEVAARKPDLQFVILVGPAINWLRQGEYNLRADLRARQAPQSELAAALDRRERTNQLLRNGATYRQYRVAHIDSSPMSADRWGFVARNYRADVTATLPRLAVPVLLELGEDDLNVDVAETERAYRELVRPELLTVQTYPHASHSLARDDLERNPNSVKAYAIGTFAPRQIYAPSYLDNLRRYVQELPAAKEGPMRILALGGPGAMGAVAVRLAAQLPGVDEIVIADRDGAAAGRLCGQLADATVRISAAQVDVTDDAALRDALEPADLVVNTVGPYYRFGVPVLRAAIATGTHYVDICDDWEPTVQMLELDETARAAGICAVIGMGASPGVSNLLAATAAAELDTVRDVYTAWPVDVPGTGDNGGEVLLGPDGRPSAAAVHWMLQSSGKICTVRAGQLTFERPLRPIGLTLPRGRHGTAYSIGHPEPITLRRTLGLTGEAVNLMVIRPQTLAYLDVLRRDIDRRRLTHETAALQFAKPNLLRYLRSIPLSLRSNGPGTLPPFFAAVSGASSGREYVVLTHLDLSGTAAGLFGDMARATGIPLAMGLSQIVDGTARRPGVHPPDAVIDARRFFADLARQLDQPADRPLVVIERDERA